MVYSIALSRYICIPGTYKVIHYLHVDIVRHLQFVVTVCLSICFQWLKIMFACLAACFVSNWRSVYPIIMIFFKIWQMVGRKCGYIAISVLTVDGILDLNMCIGVYWYYLSIMHVHLTNDVNYLFTNISIIQMIL